MSDFGREHQAAVTVQIKAEMAAKDWKQADLAAAAGMATSTLSRYLAGNRDIPLPVFAEICLALGLAVPELLARAERRHKENARQRSEGRV
jgi:transcriptional regulator with XRE-family HTH domain